MFTVFTRSHSQWMGWKKRLETTGCWLVAPTTFTCGRRRTTWGPRSMMTTCDVRQDRFAHWYTPPHAHIHVNALHTAAAAVIT